jgi:asparagine synthase (glutamine-hydrolysing)
LAAGFKAEFNRVSSIDFSLTGWTADDQNFLKGIQRLPPGCYLNIDINSGESKLQRWYMPSPNWTVAKKIGDDRNNWLSATKSAIETAVARQLVSDVPVGAFCSGGVDSSLVSAIAKRKDKNIVLFNVSCPDHPEVDEGPWAEKVARFLDTDLKTHRLTKESFKSALVKTVWYTEYPLAFLNTVPLYNLSALARDAGVKVLLSGEGADECFGGYVSQFKELAIRRVIQSKGPALKTALEFALKFSKRYAATVGFSTSSVPSSIGLHQIFAGGLNKWAELSTQIENTYGDVSDDWSREMAGELLRQMQTYMLPILHRTDRASMGASVEARVPFLDIDLVELALAMPPKFKVGVKGLKPSGKEILKEIACDFLPRDIIYRPKMGFSVPGEYYLDAWPSSWIKDGFVRSFFGLNEAALRYWLGRERGQSYAWLLTLEIWGQLFIQNRNVETVNSEYMAG